MRRLTLLLLIICLACSHAKAQQSSAREGTACKLEKLYGRLISSLADSDRIRINDSIKVLIDGYVHSDSIFNHNISSLRHLGQITSPDSLVKIITWNMVLDGGKGEYDCYFIRKKNPGEGNDVYRLSAPYLPVPISADTTCTMSDWYGALYYDIRPVDFSGKRVYMLLGINFSDPEITRKVADVLYFPSDSSLLLGKKWFYDGYTLKYRVVIEYSASATITMRFTSPSSIVFDHLVPIAASDSRGRLLYGPEYSYDSYVFDGRLWRLKINIDVRNKE